MMEDQEVILIDGEAATGKMVLRSLLDGHSRLSVLPVHDQIIDVLCEPLHGRDWLAERDRFHLRQRLARSGYYRLEEASFDKGVTHLLSSREVLRNSVLLDFGRMDSLWIGRLNREARWRPDLILWHIHRAFWGCSTPSRAIPPTPMAPVSVGLGHPGTVGAFLQMCPRGKVLYMTRDPESVAASRVGRKIVHGDVKSEAVSVTQLLKRNKPRKIRDRQRRAAKLASEFPKRAAVLDLHELVENTEQVMRRVACFLEVPFEEALLVPMMLGQPVKSDLGQTYLSRIHDVPQELLTLQERLMIQLDIGEKRLFSIQAMVHPGAVLRLLFVKASRGIKRLTVGLLEHLAGRVQENS